MKLRLIDRDGDLVTCNDEDTWDSFAECKKALIAGVKEGMSLQYLPYRFVDYDSSDDYSTMDVHARITKIFVSLDTETYAIKEEAYG